jgi:hypothetical protein
VVEPRLERGGNAEIVERHPHDEHVGRHDFRNGLVGVPHGFLLLGRATFGGGEVGLQVRFFEVGEGPGGHVAHHHGAAGVRGQQLVDDALAEAGAVRLGPAGAGNDLQNLHKQRGERGDKLRARLLSPPAQEDCPPTE